MKLKATVVCENYVLWSHVALAEHGFSVFLKTDSGNWLVDTGSGKTILHNAPELGLDLASVQGVILSHNHWDHTGGLLPVAKAKSGLEVYAHPALFRETFHDDSVGDNIGLPYSREELEAHGMTFSLSTEFREIVPGLWLTGEVPRVTEYENDGFSQMVKMQNGYEKDHVSDDQSVVIETEKGLVVVLGCCHAGIINTLTYISDKMGTKSFYAVFGGTHLAPANDEKLKKVLADLDGFKIHLLGISHCSGLTIVPALHEKFGSRFSYYGVGASLEA